jgi:hypothetical protein
MTNLCNQVVKILAFVLYGSATVVAQGTIGSTLGLELTESLNPDHRVVVYLNEKADLELLDLELKDR